MSAAPSTPHAESGELTNVTALAWDEHVSGAFTVILDGTTLSIGYRNIEERDQALEFGHSLATGIGALLHADVVWTPNTHRSGERKLTGHHADVSVGFALIAPISADEMNKALRRVRCLESLPALGAADRDLARFRTLHNATDLRNAFEKIHKVAVKRLGRSPLIAKSAMSDLSKAIAQHHHGVVKIAVLKDRSLGALETCYERTEALLDALIAKVCGWLFVMAPHSPPPGPQDHAVSRSDRLCRRAV